MFTNILKSGLNVLTDEKKRGQTQDRQSRDSESFYHPHTFHDQLE